MKPSAISTAMLVVSLFLAPALLAQSPDSANQGAASPASAAEVPRLIKFSGTLLDAQDRPLAGPVGVTFTLHSQQTGGAALWMETQNVTPDARGLYTVLLGANSANGVPAELFSSGEARWLGVQPERQPEQPRVLLVSVPYALKAADAETLGGRPLSAFQLAPFNPNGTASNNASPNGSQPAAGEQANEILCSSSTACKTGFVPLFSSNGGSATVSNSLISQSGTTVAVTGSETVTGSLGLPNTISPSVGVLTVGSMAFLHNFGGNPFVGAGAGNMTMTGTANAGFGTGALHKDTTGNNNSAFGNSALMSNTAGFSNSAFGTGALQNEQDNQNSAFGAFALQNHLFGGNNSAFGNAALLSNTTGANNAAFGFQALMSNTVGFSNSAFGIGALQNEQDNQDSAFGAFALQNHKNGRK